MRGLLADVNVQGHLGYLRHALEAVDLWNVLVELKLSLVTFGDLHLAPDLDDRRLWNQCQRDGWVLFTDNRNNDGADSLQATLADSWKIGNLPVVTLSDKGKFERDRDYAKRLATDIAELLFDIVDGQYRDQPRVFVPFKAK